MQITAEAHEHMGNQEDHEYDVFLEKINQRVAKLIADGRHLFLTDIEPSKLWGTYILSFHGDVADQQYHTCNT